MTFDLKSIEMRFKERDGRCFVDLVLKTIDGSEMIVCSTEVDTEVIRVNFTQDAKERETN